MNKAVVSVDDNKVEGVMDVISQSEFDKGHVILKKGKKVFHKVTLG